MAHSSPLGIYPLMLYSTFSKSQFQETGPKILEHGNKYDLNIRTTYLIF